MREKRYYKDMKGTQEEKKEREGGFDGAGLELKETERGNYTTAFSIKGKLII